jgi:hypothetical protein
VSFSLRVSEKVEQDKDRGGACKGPTQRAESAGDEAHRELAWPVGLKVWSWLK